MDEPGKRKSGFTSGKNHPEKQDHKLKKHSRPTSKKVDLYVVVADDDVDDHKLITKAVNDCSGNHMVTSVYNGQQLMNLLLRKGFYKVDFERLPDIIILDLKMPVMDGYQVLKELSARDRLRDIPVFILSDASLDEEIERAGRLGGHRFYSKPFSYDELKQLMSDICSEALRLAQDRPAREPSGNFPEEE